MKMKRRLVLTLGAALVAGACSTTTASDATDTPLEAGNGPTVVTAATPPAAKAAAPPRIFYRDVRIPAGTLLPLTLTSAVASDTSAVEDAVTAELTRPITIDGREVLPAGARLTGVVTQADASGRVKGRATIAFRFLSLRAGDQEYEVQTATVSHLAAATRGEDAAKIAIGAGAGAIIGGVLGGKDGAATGAAVGGSAGTGVVLSTNGKEVRLGPGVEVTTELTAPVTVRVHIS
jgi:hypothetical protein